MPTLTTNISWLTAGNALTKPLWFWFILVVCVGGLTEAGYGVFNAALAFMLIASSLTDLGTSRLTIREVARRPDRAATFFSNLLSFRGASGVLVLAGGLLLAFVLGDDAEMLWALLWAGVYAVALSGVIFCRSFYRAFEVMKWDAVSTMGEKIAVVAGGALFLGVGGSPASALMGMAAGMVLTLVVNIYWVARHLASFETRRVRTRVLQATLTRALPFGMMSFFVLVYFRIDQVMVERIVGDVAAGEYGFAYRLLEAVMLLPLVVMEGTFPRLSALFEHGERTEFLRILRRSLLVVVGLAVAVSGALYVFAGETVALVEWLAGRDGYAAAAEPLRILAWTFPFMAAAGLLSFALAASNDQRMLALLLGLAAGFNVLANLWLIPRLGASGAALTTLWTEGGVALLLSLRLAWTYRNL